MEDDSRALSRSRIAIQTLDHAQIQKLVADLRNVTDEIEFKSITSTVASEIASLETRDMAILFAWFSEWIGLFETYSRDQKILRESRPHRREGWIEDTTIRFAGYARPVDLNHFLPKSSEAET